MTVIMRIVDLESCVKLPRSCYTPASSINNMLLNLSVSGVLIDYLTVQADLAGERA
jgi:hypothetical protein